MQYLTPLGRLSTTTRAHVYGRRLAAIDIQDEAAHLSALARNHNDPIAQQLAARRYAEVRELLRLEDHPARPTLEAQALRRAYAARMQELAAWSFHQSQNYPGRGYQRQAAEFYAKARAAIDITVNKRP